MVKKNNIDGDILIMMIFLDSSILCSDFYMRGPSFKVLKNVGTIVLGQIVVDEVCNKYREHFHEQVKKLQRITQDINRMISEPIETVDDGLIEKEVKKYKDFLDFFVIESGMTVPEEYPQVSHEEVVKRALARQKPFKSDGSTGYRDYLVWRTCVNIAKTYSIEDVHFISTNTRDFADTTDKKNLNKLHPDLIKDLYDLEIPEERLRYWNGLKAFIDGYAGAIAEENQNNQDTITSIEMNEEGYQEPIQQFIDSSLIGMDVSGYDILVPGEPLILKEVNPYSDFNIEEITKINNKEYLLDICVDSIVVIETNCEFSVLQEFEGAEMDVEILSTIGNRVHALVTTGIQIHIRAIYDIASNNTISVELDYLGDYYCPYCD